MSGAVWRYRPKTKLVKEIVLPTWSMTTLLTETFGGEYPLELDADAAPFLRLMARMSKDPAPFKELLDGIDKYGVIVVEAERL